MVHATYEEVCQEMDKVFNIDQHQKIDAAAPRRNLCSRARKEHEARLAHEHEAVMPGDAGRPLPDDPGEEAPGVG